MSDREIYVCIALLVILMLVSACNTRPKDTISADRLFNREKHVIVERRTVGFDQGGDFAEIECDGPKLPVGSNPDQDCKPVKKK